MMDCIKSADGRDYKQTGFWSGFKFRMIFTMGRSGPREKWADQYRQMLRHAETCKVAGLINRGSTSLTMWPDSCSTEEDLGIKMEHKVNTSWCHFAKGKSQLGQYEQAFWLAGWLCTGLQVEHCVQLWALYFQKDAGQLEKGWKRALGTNSDSVTQPARED